MRMKNGPSNVIFLVFSVLLMGPVGKHTIKAQVRNHYTQGATAEQNANLYRLPTDLWPVHYVVRLHPELGGNFTLIGNVQIVFDVRKSTNKIVLHIYELSILNSTLRVVSEVDGREVNVITQEHSVLYQFYTVHLAEYLNEQTRYHLRVSFKGVLNSELTGFYRTFYTGENGTKSYGAATQFQPTSARMAFPCFDEPEMKATFDVVLTRQANMTSLSNMPLKESVRIDNNYFEDHFERTVPMSTYLLAFVICDFIGKRIPSSSLKTQLKIWTRKEMATQTEFGSEIAEKGLVFLEKYFNLEFPLPKLDIVAVTQMGPNAMENWGLIISRESGVLHSPGEGSIAHMKWVAYLISHELAHQWFGNIVTMKWWTELWLNEGFATYVGYRVINDVRPSWGIMKTFVVSILQTVMKLDELATSPPVRVVVNHPDEIKAMFSKISYHKGGSLLRMMKHFLGEKTFRKGLNLYLREMKYKCSEQDDLWYFMTKAAHTDGSLSKNLTVKEIMDSWTLQSGFPVLHVDRLNDTIQFFQYPFLLNPNSADSAQRSKLWWIPVSWVNQGQPNFHKTLPKIWLHQNHQQFVDKSLNTPSDWILVNPKQNGFYRVNYDTENWSKIIQQLKRDHIKIHPINRAQLIDDAFNLAKVGHFLRYETALDLLSYLKFEKNSIPWIAALNNLAYLDQRMQHTSHYGVFRDYLLSLLSPIYKSLTEVDREKLPVPMLALREIVVKWACHLEHRECVDNAVSLVDKWRRDPEKESQIAGDISEAVFCTAAREGGTEVWDFIWERYLSSSTSQDSKDSLMKGLACSNQVWILTRFLEAALRTLDRPHIPLQSVPKVYEVIANNPVGLYLVWNNLKEHWVEIEKLIGSTVFALPRLVETTTSNFITEQLKEELVAFEKKYSGRFASAESAVRQAIEKTEANIHWRKRSLRSIVLWLKKQNFTSIFEIN